MLHAFISPDNVVLKIEENIDPNVGTKPGYRWLPVIDKQRPSYDPNLQIAKQTTTLNKNNVTRGWTIRQKTKIEIDDDKNNKINTIDPIVFKILFDMQNQIRQFNNLNPFTEQEYKNILKEIV